MCAPLHTCEQLSLHTTHTHTKTHTWKPNSLWYFKSEIPVFGGWGCEAWSQSGLQQANRQQPQNNYLRKHTRKKGEEGVNQKRQDRIKKRKRNRSPSLGPDASLCLTSCNIENSSWLWRLTLTFASNIPTKLLSFLHLPILNSVYSL